MKKTILALMLAATSIEAQSAFTAYYPLENYKDTGGALPPGSIVFKPDPSVTPPDPVDPVEPVDPEPTEEEKKSECYNKINGILGNNDFDITNAVKEYDSGECTVDLTKLTKTTASARYLHDYVNMVIAFGNAGVMPSFNFSWNTDYTAVGMEGYQKNYTIMINAIKTNQIYANVTFTPSSSYRETYKGYKIYTSITYCVTPLKAMIDAGYSEYYFGSLNYKAGNGWCNARWTELFRDEAFIKTTK